MDSLAEPYSRNIGLGIDIKRIRQDKKYKYLVQIVLSGLQNEKDFKQHIQAYIQKNKNKAKIKKEKDSIKIGYLLSEKELTERNKFGSIGGEGILIMFSNIIFPNYTELAIRTLRNTIENLYNLLKPTLDSLEKAISSYQPN